MWKRFRPSSDLYSQTQICRQKSFLSYAGHQNKYTSKKTRNENQQMKHLNINELLSKVKQKPVKNDKKTNKKQQKRSKTQFPNNQQQGYEIKVIQNNSKPKRDYEPNEELKSHKRKSKIQQLEYVVMKLKEANSMLKKTVQMLLEKFKQISMVFRSQIKNIGNKFQLTDQLQDTTLSSLGLLSQNMINKLQKNKMPHSLRRPPTIEAHFTLLEQNIVDFPLSFDNNKKKKINCIQKQNPSEIPEHSNQIENINFSFQTRPIRSSSESGQINQQKVLISDQDIYKQRNRSLSRCSIKSTKPAKELMTNFNETLNEMKQLMKEEHDI